MCGFVGLKARDQTEGLEREEVLKALSAIYHRSPDGNGTFQTSWLCLAHTRLSIIDLTDASKQPMQDETGRFVIVFNGEIYNYRELADRYFYNNREVNKESDTSVLIAMYKKFGRDCLNYLDGMFAFAIVDLATKKLFLARDRFGEKPLYWRKTAKNFVFSSEISALKALLPDIPWDIDLESFALYQIVGSIPAPRTIYSDVHALQPGHWLEVDSFGSLTRGAYWSLEDALKKRDSIVSTSNYKEAVSGCQKVLLKAVSSRMNSDVPVGAFLSGGVDSGAILSCLHYLGMSKLDALCIDFTDSRFSEYEMAAKTAEKFGARLHRSIITPQIFTEHLEDFFTVSDQPTIDGFNSYFVSMKARSMGIKVWLSGVGGDELFGGYPSFRRLSRLRKISTVLQPSVPNTVLEAWTKYFPHYLRPSRLFHLGLPDDPWKRAYQLMRNGIPLGNAMRILSPEIVRNQSDLISSLDCIYPEVKYCVDDFQRASALETEVYMASQLLRDIDNFSMAHSIEIRAPFLDHELFRFVFSLRRKLKLNAGRSKALLLDALPQPLPSAVLNQSKKGFTFPVEIWMKEHMNDSFADHVLNDRNRAFLEPGYG